MKLKNTSPMDYQSKLQWRAFLRKHRGAQKELARMLHISESALSQWLRNQATSANMDREVPAGLEALYQRIRETGTIAPAERSIHAGLAR